MASSDLGNLKKILISSGFEIYRTQGDEFQLADRVRDNLIMDSNVSARAEPLSVCFVTRAQRSDFAGLSEDQLFDKARLLAATAIAQGYCESGKRVVEIADPGDKARTLDLWYEVTFEKNLSDHDELIQELHFALKIEKAASASAGA